jgi:hypothetical protein
MLLKRAMKGELPLLEFAQAIDVELSNRNLPRPRSADELAPEAVGAEYLKRLAVYAMKVAVESFGPEIERHEEVLAAVADVILDAYALDSMVTRTRQATVNGQLDPVRVAAVKWYAMDAHPRAFERARRALCASSGGEELAAHLEWIAPLDLYPAYDPSELRERIVRAAEEVRGYPFASI